MLLCAVVGGGDTMSFPSSTSKRRLVSGSSKSVSTVYGGRQMESPDSSIPVSTVAATIAHLLVAQYDAADATGAVWWQSTRRSGAVDNRGWRAARVPVGRGPQHGGLVEVAGDGAGQVPYRGIAGTQRLQVVHVLDGGEDGRGVVGGAVDCEPLPQLRRDDQRRDAGTGAEAVGDPGPGRRRDVVPLTAELVVGDDDRGALRLRPGLDRLDQVDQVVAAVVLAGVSGVLVLLTDRLDEADRLEVPGLRRVDEVHLVLQVRPAGGTRCAAGEVVERLVVELEQRVRAVRVQRRGEVARVGAGPRGGAVRPAGGADVAGRVVPAAGVPGPVDALGGQPVADGRRGLRRQLPGGRGTGGERLERRLDRVDREVATDGARRWGRRAGRYLAGAVRVRGLGECGVLQAGARVQRVVGRAAVGADDRVQVGRATVGDRVRPGRRRGRDQPLVGEERAAERALEEVVGDHVVRCPAAVQVRVDRQGAGVVPAHAQPDGVAAGHVPVLPAAVDLVLLLVVPVHQVLGATAGQRAGGVLQHAVRREDARLRAGLVVRLDVVVDEERPVGERRVDRDAGGGAVAGRR